MSRTEPLGSLPGRAGASGRGRRRGAGACGGPSRPACWCCCSEPGRPTRISDRRSPFVLPAPHEVASALWQNESLLAHNLAITAQEVALGIALALLVGLALAVAIHFSPLLRRAVYPLAVGSQAIPVAVIAPLLVFWWGFGILPKLFVIVLICFFPVVVTTVDGLEGVDPEQLKLMRTLDASRWQAFRFAELPAALPAALSGARIALAVGVIGAYIAESRRRPPVPMRGSGTRSTPT